MFLTLTLLAALISIMFVASVATSIQEMHRENADRDFIDRHRVL